MKKANEKKIDILRLGVIEMDKNKELLEVRRTRILLSQKVFPKDSKKEIIQNAVSLVIEILNKQKKEFMISSVLSFDGEIIKEDEIEVEKWISNI